MSCFVLHRPGAWAGLLALNCALAAHAEAPRAELSLGEAQALATSANADLAAARDRVRSAQAAARQAGALPNPNLQLRREDARTLDVVDIAELAQPLPISGARGAARREAEAAAAAADLEVTMAEARLRADVSRAFTEVLAGEQHVQVASDSFETAASLAQAVSKRVEAGKVSPIEAQRAHITEGSARIEHEQAIRELNAARLRLIAFWGGVPGFDRAVGALDGQGPLPDWSDIEKSMPTLPELRAASETVAVHRARLDAQRARRIGDPILAAGYKNFRERGEQAYVVGVTLPLPLFDWNSAGIEAASAAVDEAEDKRRARTATLAAEVRNAWQQAAALRDEAWLLTNEMLPAAQSAFDAVRTGYELGKFSLFELLDAQRTLQQVRTQQLHAQLSYVLARIELSRLTETGLSAGKR